MRKLPSLLLTSVLLAAVSLQPVLADDWHHHDIHDFHDHDFDHWRGGHWLQAFHEGRNGWWWVVDGSWYFYPAPVYPYPDPYTPPTVVVEQAPTVVTGAPPSYVYYCANPAGYYPYVPQCSTAWQRVASSSTVVVTQPAAPAPQPSVSQRDIDDRKLNNFAAEFASVNPADRHARATLKNLETQVEAFRKSLYERDYNAMGVLKNAEDLKARIAAERASLGKAPSAPPPGAVMMPPPQ